MISLNKDTQDDQQILQNFEKVVLKFPENGTTTDLIDSDLDELVSGLNSIQDQLKEMMEDGENERLSREEEFFHKEILNLTIPIIDHLKRLVEASIELQNLADNDDRDDIEKPWKQNFARNNVEVQIPDKIHNTQSEFNQGLISAAMRVVATVGEWRRCIDNGLNGNVSKEYMIVCVKHIRETLKHLESACKVQNDEQFIFQSKMYCKFDLAAKSINSLVSNILSAINKSSHFGETKAVLLKSGCKKTGGLRRNRFSVRRVIDCKPKEKEDIHEKIRRLYEKEYKETDECLMKIKRRDYKNLSDAVVVRENLKQGLRDSTLEILRLKENALQIGVVLEKAKIREKELVEKIQEEEEDENIVF